MNERLSIDGWLVAEAALEHGSHPYAGVARVLVFRSAGGWTTLTVDREERQDDYGATQSGRATISTDHYERLGESRHRHRAELGPMLLNVAAAAKPPSGGPLRTHRLIGAVR